MQKLKSRIERMEKQLTPALHKDWIVVHPGEDEELKINEYQQQNPGKPSPNIIKIEFVKSKNSN